MLSGTLGRDDAMRAGSEQGGTGETRLIAGARNPLRCDWCLPTGSVNALPGGAAEPPEALLASGLVVIRGGRCRVSWPGGRTRPPPE